MVKRWRFKRGLKTDVASAPVTTCCCKRLMENDCNPELFREIFRLSVGIVKWEILKYYLADLEHVRSFSKVVIADVEFKGIELNSPLIKCCSNIFMPGHDLHPCVRIDLCVLGLVPKTLWYFFLKFCSSNEFFFKSGVWSDFFCQSLI